MISENNKLNHYHSTTSIILLSTINFYFCYMYYNNMAEAEDNTNTDDFLEYPLLFFDRLTGAGPRTAAAAALYWPLRKLRPRNGEMETQDPCGNTMLNEIAGIRKSLRLFIGVEYFQFARDRAKDYGLLNPDTNNNVILTSDLKSAISSLANTPVNWRLVYDIFYEFHHNRDWVSATIDKWLFENKMRLTPATRIAGNKLYEDTRGGFTAIARFAKCQAIAVFKNALYNTQQWNIALSEPSTPARRIEDRKTYFKIFIDKETFYHVVTPPSAASLAAAGLENTIIRNRCDIDANIDIDYDAIARTINVDCKALKKAIRNNSYYKETVNNEEGDFNEEDVNDEYIDEQNMGDGNATQLGMGIDENLKNMDRSSINDIVSDVIGELGETIMLPTDTTPPSSPLPLATTTTTTSPPTTLPPQQLPPPTTTAAFTELSPVIIDTSTTPPASLLPPATTTTTSPPTIETISPNTDTTTQPPQLLPTAATKLVLLPPATTIDTTLPSQITISTMPLTPLLPKEMKSNRKQLSPKKRKTKVRLILFHFSLI